jgi:hypothetical protein
MIKEKKHSINKQRAEENLLNTIKGIYEKPTAIIKLYG